MLATDLRFASERAVLGQFEVGLGAVPGGGPMARLTRLVGRGRAFDKVAVRGIKRVVDVASLPEDAEFGPGLAAFFATAGRPEHLPFAQELFRRGLQQAEGIERDLGTAIGELRQEPAPR